MIKLLIRRSVFSLLVLMLNTPLLSAQTTCDSLVILNELVHDYSQSDSALMFATGQRLVKTADRCMQPAFKASAYLYYGNHSFFLNNFSRARRYYDTAAAISNNNNIDTIYNRIIVKYGFIESSINHWRKAKDLFKKGLEQGAVSGDTLSMIEAYNGLAEILNKENKKEEAMKAYHDALRLSRKTNHLYETAYLLNNLSLLKFDNHRFDDAAKDIRLAMTLAERTGNARLLLHLQNNMGLLYMQKNDFDSAMWFYQRVLASAKSRGIPREITVGMINIAFVHTQNEAYDEALNTYDSALIVVRSRHISDYLPRCYIGKANLLNKLGRFNEALAYTDSAEDAAESASMLEDIASSYLIRSQVYRNKEDFKNAYEDYLKYKELNDSLRNQSSEQRMAELQVQYEVEQKENDLREEKAKVTLLEKEKEVQRTRLMIIVISSVAMLLILSILLYLRHVRLSRKQHQQFSQRLIKILEQERNRIARDLHDDIGQTLSTVKNRLVIAGKNGNPSLAGAERDLSRVIEQTRQISRELYPSYLNKIGLNGAINMLLKKVEHDTELMCITELYAEEDILDLKEKTHIYRIVQECIGNTIKHARASAVKVSMKRDRDLVELIYRDNGIGIKSGNVPGMGMMSIQERIRIIGGEMKTSDNKGKGVKFVFTVPIH